MAEHIAEFAQAQDGGTQALAELLELRAELGRHGRRAQQALQRPQQQVVEVQAIEACRASVAFACGVQRGQSVGEGFDVGGGVAGEFAAQVLEQHQRARAFGQRRLDGDLAVGGRHAARDTAARARQVVEHGRLELQVGAAARPVGAQARHHAASVGKAQPVDLVEAAPQELALDHLAEAVAFLHEHRDAGGGRRGLRDFEFHPRLPLGKKGAIMQAPSHLPAPGFHTHCQASRRISIIEYVLNQ